MGLDIGIISIRYLDIPKGIPYRFAWELAIEASVDGYMSGSGDNWAPFTQRKVLKMVDEFVQNRDLSPDDKSEILNWVQSLPWEDWQDDFGPATPTNADEDDYDPVLDHDDGQDGGLIELHFNW